MLRASIRNRMSRRTIGWAMAAVLSVVSAVSSAATFVSVAIAPPLLPVYVQPAIPAPGYIWTPGYWAYGPDGYYWVPGTWVLPPAVGVLWTPGYWGWRSGLYVWNAGYWGPRVGFYGGVNYGFGYTGVGYVGGYWNNGAFYYNRAVNNVNVTNIHNTYNTAVTNTTINRVSYNGGARGVRAEPTAVERETMGERHVEPTELQMQHEHAAAGNRALLASENHGRPAIAATPQPGAFNHADVVAARGNPARKEAKMQGTPQGAHPKIAHDAPMGAPGAPPHPQMHAQGGEGGHPQGQGPHRGGEPHGEGPHGEGPHGEGPHGEGPHR